MSNENYYGIQTRASGSNLPSTVVTDNGDCFDHGRNEDLEKDAVPLIPQPMSTKEMDAKKIGYVDLHNTKERGMDTGKFGLSFP